MSDAKTCPTCGATLAPDATGGACPRCLLQAGFATGGAAAADRVPSPEELAPKFPGLVIGELLGRGGMGVVYRARHRALDRDVALKVLPASLAGDRAFADRFQREARALAKLQHPNIVAVHDFGETDGLFWLVMEFVDGANIRQAMKAGAIGPKEALAIVPQICDALQYAHEHGVVHRDIKPENVLLDRVGRVKVADFGLAKMMERGETDRSLTGAGQVMGTPHYMAPEQWERPKDVDHRADIYSLGVVFYEMLTGELPVGRFAVPSKKSDVDVRIDEIVLRTLEREREARYQHVEQVKTDVGAVASSPAAAAPPAAVPAAASDDSGHGRRAPLLFAAGCLAEVPLVYLAMAAQIEWVRVAAIVLALAVPLGVIVATRRGRHAMAAKPRARWWWWAALASLVLCGGPIAMFAMLVLSSPKGQAAFESSRRHLGEALSRDGTSEIENKLKRLQMFRPDVGLEPRLLLYEKSERQELQAMPADERLARAREGALGLPLLPADRLPGRLSDYAVETVVFEAGPSPPLHAVVTLRHGTSSIRFPMSRSYDERGDGHKLDKWDFAVGQVEIE